MSVMHTRAEKEPISFGIKMGEVIAKNEKDPTSLSSSEREYIEYLGFLDHCIAGCPEYEKNMELLNKCIWNGFTLQQFKQPIQGSGTSQSSFYRYTPEGIVLIMSLAEVLQM